ncbi:MAG: hypothetical protein SFY32_07260 [Bacteroidota bacterium]|nr:hypothetical protein [Bacteroidota bacterium]
MFTIKTEELGDYSTIKLINPNTGEYLEVIPDLGAALNALVLRKENSFVDIIDGCQTSEEIESEGKKYYKGNLLFPFPNRIADGKYEFEGKKYQLEINEPDKNNAIHGLLAFEKFYVKKFETNGGFIHLELSYISEGTNPGWPFKCKVTVKYSLTSDEGVTCKTIVENTDNVNIPFGIGWHPYFKSLNRVDSLELQIPTDGFFEVDNRMIPNGKSTKENPFATKKAIQNTNFDTGFAFNSPTSNNTIELYDSVKNATLQIWFEGGLGKYNFCQLYIPPHRKTIAVEPMTCPTNAFNTGVGLISLAPGQTHEVSFGIKVK